MSQGTMPIEGKPVLGFPSLEATENDQPVAEAVDCQEVPICQDAAGTCGTSSEIMRECETLWTADEVTNLPTIPNGVYETLPATLRQIVDAMEMDKDEGFLNHKRDVVLMGAIVTLSSTFFKVSGQYLQKRYYPNLYLYVVAPFGAGKNTLLDPCRELVSSFNERLATVKGDFVLSGNITGAATMEWLSTTNGEGLIFSPEADILTESLKNEHAGTLSTMLREAWGNAPVDHARRQNGGERLRVKSPKLSIVLAGTPLSVPRFFADTQAVENGLFSRFAFYCMQGDVKIATDIFSDSQEASKEERLAMIGEGFAQRWEQVFSECEHLYVNVQERHRADFHSRLQELLDVAVEKLGQDVGTGLTFRNGILCWRIAMVLSAIRLMDNEESVEDGAVTDITDDDYRSAWTISRVLWYHTVFVLRNYIVKGNQQGVAIPLDEKLNAGDLLAFMEPTFTTKEWLDMAASVSVPEDTANKWLARLTRNGEVQRIAKGQYKKTAS